MKKFLLILMTCAVVMGLYAQIPAGDGQPCPGKPTVTDHEGNVYNTVRIGNQCWMKENLRTTTSPSTGTYLIPPVGTDLTYSGKQARWYNNDSATYAPMNYGLLYNWNAAMDTFRTTVGETSVSNNAVVSMSLVGHRRGICPAGWHLPNYGDWSQLNDYVKSVPEYWCDNSENNNAKALASTTGWAYNTTSNCAVGNDPSTNNATGFSALPAGSCAGPSLFSNPGTTAAFWAAEQHGSSYYGYNTEVINNYSKMKIDYSYKKSCLSVRCILDEPHVSSDGQPCPGIPTVTDMDSNVYNTVKIGNQCWMKENIRTKKMPNGATIYAGNMPSPNSLRYYNYSNSVIPLEERGYLYNFYTAMNGAGYTSYEDTIEIQGICPKGWHLPSENEFATLVHYVQTIPEYTCNSLVTKALSSTSGWYSSTTTVDCSPCNQNVYPNNATGFTAVPAGYFYYEGEREEYDENIDDFITVMGGYGYKNTGKEACFWSTTSDGDAIFYLDLYYEGYEEEIIDPCFNYFGEAEGCAMSVRCLRNVFPTVTTGQVFGLTCGGEVVENGGSDVIARGVCWSTEHNPTVADAHSSDGTGLGTFTSNLTNLSPNTTYYVRAYATNSAGTSYGMEVSFTTLSCSLIPTDATVSDVTAESAAVAWSGTNDSYQVHYRTLARVDTSFMEGFENGIPSTWTTIDQDGDGHNWFYYNEYPHSGLASAASESFDMNTREALTPDNWLITPQLDLQGTMKVWLRSIDVDYPDEHFAIYLSTTGKTIADFTTTLVGETTVTNDYVEYSADLSGYAGQQGYIAIRHFNCTDMNRLVVDDFGIYGDSIPAGEWHTVSCTDTFVTLTGLNPATSYEVMVRGICNNSPSEVRGSVQFTTSLCNSEDQCDLTFVLTDSYGDGWNGNAIQVTDAETGIVLATLTNENLDGVNGTETQTVNLGVCNGRTVKFKWNRGSYADETSYTVYNGQGEIVFSGTGGFSEPFIYMVNCCPSPTNVTASDIAIDNATITWEGSNSSYNVRYRTSARVATFFEEGFENGIPSTWTTLDQDGDGHGWFLNNYTSQSYNGSGNAASESFDLSTHTALTPDNWLITPQIDLQGTMKVWMRGSDPETDFLEHFAIYLSTTGNAVSDFTTTLVGESVTTNTYTEYSADLSGYAGQQGYIAIRHFNCTEMNRLLVDDFSISEELAPVGEWHTVSSTDTFVTLTGLTSGTRYEVQVQGVCNGGPSEWSEAHEFTTDFCLPSDKCELTFVLTDSYGDSWNGNAIQVIDAETGSVVATLSNENLDGTTGEETQTVTLAVCDGRTVNFEWVQGFYAEETSYTVYDGRGDVVFSGSGGFTAPISYMVSCASPCLAISLPFTENFDSYTTSTTAETGVQPDCWEVINEDVALTNATKPQVYCNATYATSGSYTLRMKNRCVYAMPALDENVNVNNLTMTFKLRQPKAVYRLQVGVVNENNMFEVVKTINNASTGTEGITVDFSTYTGDGRRIAFRNTLSSSSTLDYSVNYIDDIALDYPCESIELPYAENFDGYTTSTTAETGVQPRCWEVVSEDVALTNATKPQVYYNANYATSGSYTLRMKNRCMYAMPVLGADVNISELTMTFKLRQPKAVYRLQVGVVNEEGVFSVVKTINNASTDTENVTVDFAGYTGSGHRIAFRNTVPSGSTLDYSVNYIDNIKLDYTPEPCGISALPYTENFDSYTTSTTAETGVQPDCWEVVSEDVALTDATKPQVYYNANYASSGSYTLRMKNRCVYAMPELVNDNIQDLTMTFKLRQPKAVYRLQVGVVDANGRFRLVKTINNASTDTEDVTVDFSGYNGNGYTIAFRNTVASGSTLDYSVNYIDNIVLDYTPAPCGIRGLPYAENFDSYTTSTTAETGVQPDCWEVVNEDVALTDATKPQVYYNASYASSGSYTLRMKNRCVYAMPELDADVNVSGLTMTFRLRQPKAVYRLQVGVVNEEGVFSVVKTINNASTGTEDVVVDFANYTGGGNRIAFRNTVPSGSTLDYSVNYIDNIELDYSSLCGIRVLPYAENFDGYTSSTTAETGVQPDCWEVIQEDVALTNATKPQVYYNASYATSGSYTLRMKNRCVFAMPGLDANVNVNELTMTFSLRQPKAVYRLQVGVVDALGNFEVVKTINNSSTNMEDVSVNFSNYTGNGRRIAFRNTLGSGSTLDYSVNYIDDINLTRTTASKSMEVTDADAGMLETDRNMVDVIVYPNPTKDVVNVECTMNNVQCSGIEVIDVYGKVVRNVVGANNDSPLQTQINVSGLASGMYFVRVTTDKGMVTRPFVKR